MSVSNCPLCQQSVLPAELERHVNSHFEHEGINNSFQDEQFAMDFALAQAIELSSFTPPQTWVNDPRLYEIPQSSSGKHEGKGCSGKSVIEEKTDSLARVQIRQTNYQVKGGLISLLKNCLEKDSDNSTSVLSGCVDHFRSTKSEDIGWGCGWRNIQMMSSYLLKHRQEAREVLFGGSEFVPDIVSLQRWLEIAWEKGFDPVGSNYFNHKIYGKRDWIGTTECATIFRSFGLRARIVDLCSKSIASIGRSRFSAGKFGVSDGKKIAQVYGPMDRFLSRGDGITPEAGPSGNGNDKYLNNDPLEAKGHQRLMDWVWSYFSDDKLSQSGRSEVILSEKMPLYFQHDGHSRTIVGIQAKRSRKGMKQYNLLVLDPGVPTEVLERSLRLNSGWQKLIKRGVHTLKKLEYQLCYIDPGIATDMEMEELKTVDSVYIEF